eukprot:GHVP01039032.1.p1 GENE.GHVP01039032.1~~GHVP01039032.1.p1  ORF type:complete len:210 (-),score=33.53 GHVP01039032.1:48-677(-)
MFIVKKATDQFEEELKSFKEIWYFNGLFVTEESLVTKEIQILLGDSSDNYLQPEERKLLLRKKDSEIPKDILEVMTKVLNKNYNPFSHFRRGNFEFEGAEIYFLVGSAEVLGRRSDRNIFYVLPDDLAKSLRQKFERQVSTLAARTGRSKSREVVSSVFFLAVLSLAVGLGLELNKPQASRMRRSSGTESSSRPSKSHSRGRKKRPSAE